MIFFFFFSVIWRGRLHRFLAARSNCHLITCTRLISDTSSCQTACFLLHNTNEQLSRTDKHMKKWPSGLFLSSLKTSTLPVKQPVQPNMHGFLSTWWTPHPNDKCWHCNWQKCNHSGFHKHHLCVCVVNKMTNVAMEVHQNQARIWAYCNN